MERKAQIRNFLETLFEAEEYIFDMRTTETTSRFQFEVSNRLPLPLVCLNAIDGKRDKNPTREFHRFDRPRRADANCVSFRNFMLEFDTVDGRQLTVDEQIDLMERKYKLPYSTAVWSGNKSVHFVISLTEPLEESWWRKIARSLTPSPSERKDFKERGQWLGVEEADIACKNPTRGTRCPGVIRPDTGQMQELLVLNGRVSFDDFITSFDIQTDPPRKFYTGEISTEKIEEIYQRKLAEVQNAPQGSRHSTMVPFVFFAVKSGIPKERIEADLRNSTSIPPREIRACVAATSP